MPTYPPDSEALLPFSSRIQMSEPECYSLERSGNEKAE